MVKTNVKLVDDVNREPPDIFRAAINDDVRELRAALSEGQSLDTPNRLHYGMTPVHLACAKHSLNFIDEALKETFNAWARDLGGRLSMDYAIAEGLEDVAEMLLERLYPRDASGRPRMPF
ncbi:MAG TPA: ankyrin repeat domain-containing protein [Rhizorhapis sp.]